MDYFTLQIANLFFPTTHNHICCVPLNEYNLGAEQNGTHYLDTPARPMDFRRLKNSCWHTVQYIMWLIQSTSYSSRALSESKSARVISYFQLSFKSNTSRRYVCYCFNVVDAPGLTVKRVPFEMAWSLHTHTHPRWVWTRPVWGNLNSWNSNGSGQSPRENRNNTAYFFGSGRTMNNGQWTR